ncbi:MAG: FAD-dependent thymidylate synthase [Candidatus Parvarchaeota archaeon]
MELREIRIVKPEISNFELVKGEKAWEEVVYSARMSGVPQGIPAEEVFKMIVRNDYGSALEHIILKFDVKMTKGNAPELLEHRIASHSGYSTRYVRVYEGVDREEQVYEIILPQHLNGESRDRFLTAVSNCLQLYEELLASGLPKESARYVLPFCLAVGIYHYTINLRSLLNLLGLRLCVRASPEFRCLASQLYFNLIKSLPLLHGLVGCRGFMRGACPESDVTGVRVGKQHPFYPPCPFKNRDTDIFIPTVKELRDGVKLSCFNTEKAVEVQEKLFRQWAAWH